MKMRNRNISSALQYWIDNSISSVGFNLGIYKPLIKMTSFHIFTLNISTIQNVQSNYSLLQDNGVEWLPILTKCNIGEIIKNEAFLNKMIHKCIKIIEYIAIIWNYTSSESSVICCIPNAFISYCISSSITFSCTWYP